jgi:hypothetical protein
MILAMIVDSNLNLSLCGSSSKRLTGFLHTVLSFFRYIWSRGTCHQSYDEWELRPDSWVCSLIRHTHKKHLDPNLASDGENSTGTESGDRQPWATAYKRVVNSSML